MADLRYALTTGSPGGYDGIYTSIKTWWDTECATYDFVANGNNKILECFDDWPSGLEEFDILLNENTGYSANANNHATITIATGAEHKGLTTQGFSIWINKYSGFALNVQANHVHINGLRIRCENQNIGIDSNRNLTVIYRRILIHGSCHIGIQNIGNTQVIESSIILTNRAASYGIRGGYQRNTGLIRNCVTRGFDEGYGINAGSLVAHNCAAYNSPTNAFNPAITGDYNAADDATAPGANSIQDLVAGDFKDDANDDLHIDPGSRLEGAGENLYDGTGMQADIDGDLWPAAGAWNIGADYIPSAAPEPENAIFFGTDF